MQNGFVESFNGRLCDEFLNETLFTSLMQVAWLLRSGVETTTTSDRILASAG
jgi:Integrase core domain